MENKSSSGCKFCIILSILALVVASAAYFCPKKLSTPCPDTTLDEKVKGIVLEAIKQNPQLLMDAMGEGIAKKREDAIKQLSSDVAANDEEISKQSMKFGNLDSKKTLICFFDPLCKHCIEFQKSMLKLVKKKKDVCFKLIPVALLGEDSVTLAKVYVSVYMKNSDKMLDFIERITKHEGEMDKSAIEKALKAAGLDSKEIEEKISEADKKLADNGMLAEKLKLPVVPGIFLVKDSNVSMVQVTGVDQLEEVIGGNPKTEIHSEEKTSEKTEEKK